MVRILNTFALLTLLAASVSAAAKKPAGAASSAPAPAATSASTTPQTASPNTNTYPAIDVVPPTTSAQVQDWLKLVDFTQVPNFPASNAGNCPATPVPKEQCWWTCDKCVAPDDVMQCPAPKTWGVTYDDGPSPYTPQLLDFLKANNIKATFFVVGSRVIDGAAILQRAYQEGHQIAIHTWSHHALTSLTNEQIVAEFKWTEKIIKDTIGVSPSYYRPPFGDVDNRVRAIARQLGFKNVIWTNDFDTDDWEIPEKKITANQVTTNFQTWMQKVPSMANGFIVLEHDLYKETVAEAQVLIPIAQKAGLTMTSVSQCIGDLAPYKELNGTATAANSSVAVSSSAAAATASGAAPTTTASSTSDGTVGAASVNGTGASPSPSTMSSSSKLLSQSMLVTSTVLIGLAGLLL